MILGVNMYTYLHIACIWVNSACKLTVTSLLESRGIILEWHAFRPVNHEEFSRNMYIYFIHRCILYIYTYLMHAYIRLHKAMFAQAQEDANNEKHKIVV